MTPSGGKENNPFMFDLPDEAEPPSPTLESLGISEFGLGLIKGAGALGTDTSTPSSTRLSAWSSRSVSDLSSPATPPTTIMDRRRDRILASGGGGGRGKHSESLFGQLLDEVDEDEFGKLPTYLAAQLSLEFLNDTISEINEYFTDKRFSGMDMLDDNDIVTIEELQQVETIESTKIKAVMVALLHLNRMDSEDDGKGGKRYRIKT
ncbi:hypothetical protein HDU67_009289 [Dinochytrium kinnereticum]|nr:hypothetical protein HDU67_009289 [Dinochytrium kinnereticum]